MSWGRKRVGVWGWKPGPLTWRIIPVSISKYLGSPPCRSHEKAIWKGKGTCKPGLLTTEPSGGMILHVDSATRPTLGLVLSASCKRGAPNPRCYTAALRSAPWRSAVEVHERLVPGMGWWDQLQNWGNVGKMLQKSAKLWLISCDAKKRMHFLPVILVSGLGNTWCQCAMM